MPEIANKKNTLDHIAFIMDGNGRWAKKRGMPREYGHKIGVEAFKRMVEACNDIGVKCITVYAFSTENWKRPKKEVDSIMGLLDEYLGKECPDDISIRIIGDIDVLDKKLKDKILDIENKTKDGSKILNIAINYGSRSEIVRAFNRLMAQGKTCISEEDIQHELYTYDCPDPDLIIRTGGDIRISNFLLWQAAYSELYFTDTLWPDMTREDLMAAVENYYTRKRRYGGLDK